MEWLTMENEVNNMEQRKAECLSVLLEKGKTKGNLTYKDISDQVDHIEFDKDQMDEIYDTLYPTESKSFPKQILKILN